MDIKNIVESELHKYYEAFNAKDVEVVKKYLNENFRLFTDKCIIQNRDEFISTLENDNWQGSGFNIFDLQIDHSQDSKFALASYNIEFYGLHNGVVLTVEAIETTLLIKNNDQWQLLHCHATNK